MNLSFHLSFNSNDPFEVAVYRALRTLPRGYAKLFFMRSSHLFFGDERNPKRMARVMYDFGRDARPTCVTVLPRIDYLKGSPSAMLAYYPPSVEEGVPTKCYRSKAKDSVRARMAMIRELDSQKKNAIKRVPAEPHEKMPKAMQEALEYSATGARPKAQQRAEPLEVALSPRDKPKEPKIAKQVVPEPPAKPVVAAPEPEPEAQPVAEPTPDNVVPIGRKKSPVLGRLCWN